jgi:hypothetical protein
VLEHSFQNTANATSIPLAFQLSRDSSNASGSRILGSWTFDSFTNLGLTKGSEATVITFDLFSVERSALSYQILNYSHVLNCYKYVRAVFDSWTLESGVLEGRSSFSSSQPPNLLLLKLDTIHETRMPDCTDLGLLFRGPGHPDLRGPIIAFMLV